MIQFKYRVKQTIVEIRSLVQLKFTEDSRYIFIIITLFYFKDIVPIGSLFFNRGRFYHGC